ncbi:MAG: RDD family protein [Acidimicrobiales bacterium]|nr:RDD family protein [Acidimicrobiales bacterium]
MSAYQVPVDPTKVSGRRIVAVIIDVLIVYLLSIAVFAAVAEQVDTRRDLCSDATNEICIDVGDTVYVAEGGDAGLVSGASLAVNVAIFILLRGLTGATPGTLLTGIRCVREDGRSPGLIKATVRSVAGIVDYLPCCFPLVGFITMLTTKGHRRVGDMAAKTFMVRSRDKGRPVVVPGLTPAAPVGYAAPGYGAAPYGAPATTVPGVGAAPTPDAQWDADRGTWVRFDRGQQRWYGLDRVSGDWYPL